MHTTWKYACVRFCKVISLSSGDGNNLDRILGGPVSNELVAMTESSPQQPRSLEPASRYDAGISFTKWQLKHATVAQQSCPPVMKAGRENYGEEALGKDQVFLSLMRYFSHTYALLVTWKTLASSLHLCKFIPTKVKCGRRFPLNTKI